MSVWGFGGQFQAPLPFIQGTSYNIPGFNNMQNTFTSGAKNYAGRTDQNSPFYQGELQNIKDLQGVIAGTAGPSVAEQQLKQTTDENLKNSMAIAASARGNTNPGLLQRNVQQQGAQTQQTAAGQAATMRAGEIADARDRLGTLLSQGRTQDQAMTQMNDEMVRFNLSQGMNLNLAQADANMRLQEVLSQIKAHWNNMNLNAFEFNQNQGQQNLQWLTGLGQQIGQGIGNEFSQFNNGGGGFQDQIVSTSSDEENKTDFQSTDSIPSGDSGGVIDATGGGDFGGGFEAPISNDSFGDIGGMGDYSSQAGPGFLSDSYDSAASYGADTPGTMTPETEVNAENKDVMERDKIMNDDTMTAEEKVKALQELDDRKAAEPQKPQETGAPSKSSALGTGKGFSFSPKIGGKSGGSPAQRSPISSLIFSNYPSLRGTYSDKRLKVDTKKTNNILTDFMDSMESYRFRYKDPGKFGHGPRYGVIAQDVEKTPVGKTIVHNTPDGKMLDPQVGFGVLLASIANLNKRLRDVEGTKRGPK